MTEQNTPDVETAHELVLTDRFAATREQVWAAWTEPDQFARWWVAPAWTTHDLVMELHPRGRFAAVQSADDGSVRMPFAGFYVSVEPFSRLVFTLSDSDDPDVPARTVMTVLLRETQVDGEPGTEQEFHQTGVVTDEHFAALEAGTRMFFGQLAAHLSERTGATS